MAAETFMALLLSLYQLYLDRSQREGQGSGYREEEEDEEKEGRSCQY
jgi:hypothetical protein